MSGGEQWHIVGQDGVALAKRWLEGTGRFDVQWHSGQDVAVPYLEVEQVQGEAVGFDIRALHRTADRDERAEVFVEVKNYSGVHDQPALYKKFLTVCASALLAWEDIGGAAKPTEFMWLTWHPFGATNAYLRHVQPVMVKAACQEEFPVPGDPNTKSHRVPQERITDELCQEVANRLWFLIAPQRLEDMLLKQS